MTDGDCGNSCAGCKDTIRQEVEEGIRSVLKDFGLHEDDRVETVKDLVHLRNHRIAQEQVSGWARKTVITTIILGALGSMWVGFKILIGLIK